jgi:N-acyl-D-aspartate/D-glutamate deacylase
LPLDLVVRGGSLIDGTGSPARTADVGVSAGVVTEVGRVRSRARQEIDADGAIVAPGFVDIHTHYDGQATWDERLQPSSWQGVTTVVMGNCGVGFAPVREPDHAQLVELMEGVEDLPGSVLHEGLSWEWESVPDYLDALERLPHDIDLAAQVCHGPLRLYVMGQRGADREPATAEEIAEMGRIAAEGVRAGALGFTTSRTLNHRTSRGEPTPTLTAARQELVGIAREVGRTGSGVLQVVSDFPDFDDEARTLVEMARESGAALSVSLAQAEPGDGYRRVLELLAASGAEGLAMRAQVAARAIGLLVGLQCSLNPLRASGAYRDIEGLPLPERVERLSEPGLRARVAGDLAGQRSGFRLPLERVFELGDPPDYEPERGESVAARAAAAGVPPEQLLLDLLLGERGTAMLYMPFNNYFDGNLDAVGEMLAHPRAVPGLGDGGAHVGLICDASFPTTLLAHWGRDRSRGTPFELPWLVNRQCWRTAAAVGLRDRGVLAPGYKADLNVIDFDDLALEPPVVVCDLPAGGRRLLQRARGYRHTVVSGVEVYADSSPTGSLPGRLVRGCRPGPSLEPR